ncbi:MAG: hypothetical protein AB7U05_11285 [Mangrovibacterium sp.]
MNALKIRKHFLKHPNRRKGHAIQQDECLPVISSEAVTGKKKATSCPELGLAY